MTWTPDIIPQGQKWLQTMHYSEVTETNFTHCCIDYIRHLMGLGIEETHFQDPDTFFHPGDLQYYANVASVWSVDPRAPRLPTLDMLLTAIRIIDEPRTFKQTLDFYLHKLRRWAIENGHDPDNLNETKEERARRLARDRMRRKRMKDSEVDITDAEELELLHKVREAKENAKKGRAWFNEQEILAKNIYDEAVNAAKLHRSQTIRACQEHVSSADRLVIEAESALSAYRANK